MTIETRTRVLSLQVPIDQQFTKVASRELKKQIRRQASALIDASRVRGDEDEISAMDVRAAAQQLWDVGRAERARRVSWLRMFVALPFGFALALMLPIFTQPFNWVAVTLLCTALLAGSVLIAVIVRIERGDR